MDDYARGRQPTYVELSEADYMDREECEAVIDMIVAEMAAARGMTVAEYREWNELDLYDEEWEGTAH
jgi:hypothetical protein